MKAPTGVHASSYEFNVIFVIGVDGTRRLIIIQKIPHERNVGCARFLEIKLAWITNGSLNKVEELLTRSAFTLSKGTLFMLCT